MRVTIASPKGNGPGSMLGSVQIKAALDPVEAPIISVYWPTLYYNARGDVRGVPVLHVRTLTKDVKPIGQSTQGHLNRIKPLIDTPKRLKEEVSVQ